MGRLQGSGWRDSSGNNTSYEYEYDDVAADFLSEELQEIIQEQKVRGGLPTLPGQIPHQVSIQDKARSRRHFCGASIIHPLILLTAAHCFDTFKVLRNLRAVTGEQNLAVTENTEQIRNISRLIIHENWNGTIWDNDIALLVLDKPLEFDKYTQPIRIPKANSVFPRTAEVSGWGLVNQTRTRTPEVLQKATIAIRTRAECNKFFKSSDLLLTENMICAGGNRDACEGDSGGPLTCKSFSGAPFLCGIVSWGKWYCQNIFSPGVYTDVSKYHEWITSHVQEIRKTHLSTQNRNACGAAAILQPQITCITCGIDYTKGKLGLKPDRPYMALFHLQADIEHRYSRTQVTSVMVNPNGTNSDKVNFSVHLPDTAFISSFSMNINGTAYDASVEDREAAWKKYNSSMKGSHAARIVESSFLHENLFNVTATVPPGKVVTFTLTYEELLPRREGMYEQAIHIDLDKLREGGNYEIVATISDSRNITVLRALGTSSAVAIDEEIEGANVLQDGNVATVSWSPDTSKPDLPQHFVLQYDVEPEADTSPGQIIIRDGYFAHFFSPNHIPPFEKHLIFLLEVSSSIDETMLAQLKEGVVYMLNELERRDHFSIITFNDNVRVRFENKSYRQVKKAQNFTKSLKGNGGANLHGALMKALNMTLALKSKKQPSRASSSLPSSIKPIIVLFSTGNVTRAGGISNHTVILSEIAAANADQNVPIFSLAYGPSPDFAFLRRLSVQNNGFARKVSPEFDHSLELTNFYTEISSPLLDDLSFTYNTSTNILTVSDVTATSFPSYFKGTSLVVMGKLEKFTNTARNNGSQWFGCDEQIRVNATFGVQAEPGIFSAVVHGRSKDGWREFTSSQSLHCNCLQTTSSSSMERLWAYLKIKEALQEAGTITEDQLNEIRKMGCERPGKYAQQLALKYGFLTPVTSLVFAQPSGANVVVESPEEDVLAGKAGIIM